MASQKIIDDFQKLRNFLIIVRRDFNTFNALYCDENRDLLTSTAPTFFTDIGEILQRDWILQVVKLMDPAVSNVKGGQRENLTIQSVMEELEIESLITDEIRENATAIFDYGRLIIPARNRLLAHRDRECQYENIALGATTEEQLNTFIGNIQRFVDLVGIQIGLGPLDFSASSCKGDVYDLLSCLGKYQRGNQSIESEKT